MMIRKFLKERYFCGLDIGTQTIKACLIKSRDDHHPGLLGVHETKTCGFVEASVSDLGEMAQSIHEVMSGLIRKAGVNLKTIQLGIGGEFIEKRISDAVVPLVDHGNKVISIRDVKRLQAQARLLGINMDENILYDFPQYYKIDDVNITANPVSLYGRKLEIHNLLLVVNNTLLKNVIKAVNHAGYDVANVFFSSHAAATACLTPGDRKGCLFVDIGARITDVLCFKDGHLKDFECFPIGGSHFSDGIAKHLKLSEVLAEEIKRSYGFVHVTGEPSREEILVKQEEGYLPIRKSLIGEALEPVMAEFEESLIRAWNASNLSPSSHGIILTGGGAQLLGLPERIEMKTGASVKFGKVHIAVRRVHDSSICAGAVGLAQEGLLKSVGSSVTPTMMGHGLSRLANKVKELYQEYF